MITTTRLINLDQRGATSMPRKANRKIQRDYEAEVYKWRHLVENYFARGIATRYDKTDCSYAACWNQQQDECPQAEFPDDAAHSEWGNSGAERR
jgi:hypothetical protein